MIQGRWLNRFFDDRSFVVLRPDILESCSDLMKSPPLLRDPSANPSNQTIILSSPASISVCKGESRTYRRSSANLKAALLHVKSSWTADERVGKLSKKAETLRSCLCLRTLHIRKSDFNTFRCNISVGIFPLFSNFHICHQAVLDLIFC